MTKSILSADGYAENKSGYYKDVIFFKINYFKERKEINLLIDVHKMRGLLIGLEELLLNDSSGFKAFTESDGNKNTISIGKDAKYFYINMEQTGGSSLKLNYMFGQYGIKAFMQTMRLFCDELEKFVYTHQQMKTQ